ncbi:uncharacterized protein LOC143891683 [Tasmannia lanceolata]|uniref:uncharacterized protein LOC143891683 n=1 Tax=Tasmannia lanceolata TaxID=3420 RepID=UPI0040645725
MEIFSCLLNKAQAMGKIKTPFSKGNLYINHVMYADDVMIFIIPDIESVVGIKDCLCINEGMLPIKYLGLPLITKRLSSQDCQPLFSKIRSRLGIVVDIIKASQLKLLWHIVHNRRSLWVCWFKVKYLKKSSFWNRPMPSKSPWGVRSIFNCRDLAKPYLCYYCVGKGRDIDFWTDPWHPDGPVQSLTSEGELFCITKKISIENMKQDGSWDHITQQPHMPQLNKIMRTGLYSNNDANRIIWKNNPNGNFSLRSAWNQSRIRCSEVPWFKTVWNKGHIPRHNFTTWQAMQNRLSTRRHRLFFLGSNRDINCLLCKAEPESVNHLFFQCSYSAWIWRSIPWRCGYRRKPLKTLLQEEMWVREKCKGDGQATSIMRIGFCVLVYMIWRERNSRLHGKTPCHKTGILQSSISSIHSRLAHLQIGDVKSRKNEEITSHFGLPSLQVRTDAEFCSWVRPEQRFIKENTDAAVQNGKGGIGGLIRNSVGLALLRGHDSIWIESDSLAAVNVILEKWECPWKAIPIVEEIQDALLQTQKCKLSHTWREANGAANFLSKPDYCCKGADISPSIIPPMLRDILELHAAGHIYPRFCCREGDGHLSILRRRMMLTGWRPIGVVSGGLTPLIRLHHLPMMPRHKLHKTLMIRGSLALCNRKSSGDYIKTSRESVLAGPQGCNVSG